MVSGAPQGLWCSTPTPLDRGRQVPQNLQGAANSQGCGGGGQIHRRMSSAPGDPGWARGERVEVGGLGISDGLEGHQRVMLCPLPSVCDCFCCLGSLSSLPLRPFSPSCRSLCPSLLLSLSVSLTPVCVFLCLPTSSPLCLLHSLPLCLFPARSAPSSLPGPVYRIWVT